MFKKEYSLPNRYSDIYVKLDKISESKFCIDSNAEYFSCAVLDMSKREYIAIDPEGGPYMSVDGDIPHKAFSKYVIARIYLDTTINKYVIEIKKKK